MRDVNQEIIEAREALRAVVEAWDREWDCSAVPGHGATTSAVEVARGVLNARSERREQHWSDHVPARVVESPRNVPAASLAACSEHFEWFLREMERVEPVEIRGAWIADDDIGGWLFATGEPAQDAVTPPVLWVMQAMHGAVEDKQFFPVRKEEAGRLLDAITRLWPDLL